MLINPSQIEGDYDEEGLLWLANMYGEIVLRDIDVFSHTEGFDLFNPDELFGLNDYVANLCDALLIMAGVDILSTEEEDDALIAV